MWDLVPLLNGESLSNCSYPPIVGHPLGDVWLDYPAPPTCLVVSPLFLLGLCWVFIAGMWAFFSCGTRTSHYSVQASLADD